jgi:hypothetical protein
MNQTTANYDEPWKEALTEYFEAFLYFFFRFFGLSYAMDEVIRNETFIETDIAAIFVNCLRSGAN